MGLKRNLGTFTSTAVLSLTLAACGQTGSDGETQPTATNSAAPSGAPAADADLPGPGQAKDNDFWWPKRVNLAALRKNGRQLSPYGEDFDYAKAFEELDLNAVKEDLKKVMRTSQDWWPADYGHYGPFFIRMAWHSAGTYRTIDGRGGAAGGQQRFEPLNSWPDNANLDKARRLIWPIKQKYGKSISWADLIVLAGTVAMEDMGFKTLGFAGGREDDWEAEMVYWGPEAEMLASKRHSGQGGLHRPLGATHMGLIYVNPEGPMGKPDPIASAKNIRETFARMAMNDEETVALIAGGHTFGKAHGAHKDECLEVEPGGAGVEQQGMGWKNKCGTGKGKDAHTSGFEGSWTADPTKWTHQYLTHLWAFEWVQTKSPAGKVQWIPKSDGAKNLAPDAHEEGKRHAPIMFTTDLALKKDPAYAKISKRFKDDPKAFEQAFARAWFKLTHRDMGPRARYVGSLVPEEQFIWQDPLPEADYTLVNAADVASLKEKILASGLTVPQLVRTAWSSASTYRDSDMRGGANGARIRLAPQKDWPANNPEELAKVLASLEQIQKDFNASAAGGKQLSMADMIVLAGSAAIEKAAEDAGVDVEVPFVPGRVDATAEQTDADAFAVLEPKADGFRNYYESSYFDSPAKAMVDRADLLDLSVDKMTALVGGLRALDANHAGAKHGVFTEKPGTLTNDFFVNLLDMTTKWEPSKSDEGVFEGKDRKTGKVRWTATECDLVFGSNAELRAVAEVYAMDRDKFIRDFVATWVHVMRADRFDLR